MFYSLLTGLLLLLALVCIYWGIKPFFRHRWFLVWLKSTLSLLLVAFAFSILLLAYDFSGYSLWDKDRYVATISTHQLGPQEYQVDVVVAGGDSQRYVVAGDFWQLDARVIAWPAWMGVVGVTTGYKLDRLSGRYLSLEDEQSKPRTLFKVSSGRQVLDVWSVAKKYDFLPWAIVNHGSGTYLPMKDGTIFEVRLGESALFGKPLNNIAENAVGEWK